MVLDNARIKAVRHACIREYLLQYQAAMRQKHKDWKPELIIPISDKPESDEETGHVVRWHRMHLEGCGHVSFVTVTAQRFGHTSVYDSIDALLRSESWVIAGLWKMVQADMVH